MEERSLVGLEARTADGTEVGRITEVISDEESGEVTHVVVEREEEEFEVPLSSLSLEPETDFAIFHADPSDAGPGERRGDETEPQGYAPAESDEEDHRHEGQFVTGPVDPAEMASSEDLEREPAEAGGWEDEGSNTPESGYPRNDAYIDPETGEEYVDPYIKESETLKDDVRDLLEGTGLDARRVTEDGFVELTGRVGSQEDLETAIGEIMGLDDVAGVDTAEVELG